MTAGARMTAGRGADGLDMALVTLFLFGIYLGWDLKLSAGTPLPCAIAGLAGGRQRAERLLETACELELEPGRAIQWFAVRIDPPGSGAS